MIFFFSGAVLDRGSDEVLFQRGFGNLAFDRKMGERMDHEGMRTHTKQGHRAEGGSSR